MARVRQPVWDLERGFRPPVYDVGNSPSDMNFTMTPPDFRFGARRRTPRKARKTRRAATLRTAKRSRKTKRTVAPRRRAK